MRDKISASTSEPEWVTRARHMRPIEVQIVKSDLQRDTIQKRLKAIHNDIIVKTADRAGFFIVCRREWPHRRWAKRSPNKSGHNPADNLKDRRQNV